MFDTDIHRELHRHRLDDGRWWVMLETRWGDCVEATGATVDEATAIAELRAGQRTPRPRSLASARFRLPHSLGRFGETDLHPIAPRVIPPRQSCVLDWTPTSTTRVLSVNITARPRDRLAALRIQDITLGALRLQDGPLPAFLARRIKCEHTARAGDALRIEIENLGESPVETQAIIEGIPDRDLGALLGFDADRRRGTLPAVL